ncbi:hypothetical protein PYJP_13620 [Pyrofollis japonicus]|nr:hypothetical protein PYJP_13620 [Pyrofollis japonicus]
MVDVIITSRENDGAAWFEDDKIFINIRWLQVEDEAEWFIDESFIHEYVEHILGLGHENAVFVERVLRMMLYSQWYGQCPINILYGDHYETNSRINKALSQPEHEALQLSLSQHQDGLVSS